MKKLLAFCILLLIGATLPKAPAQASSTASPAFVIPHSGGLSCTIGIGPNVYTGASVLVVNSGGNVNFKCTAGLVGGPGVEEGTVSKGVSGPFGTTCRIAETPSGVANANCH